MPHLDKDYYEYRLGTGDFTEAEKMQIELLMGIHDLLSRIVSGKEDHTPNLMTHFHPFGAGSGGGAMKAPPGVD